jgi:hypothetical protein
MKKLLIPILFSGTLVMIIVMSKTSTTLKTAATPLGILNLEFASTQSKTSIITKAWAPNNTINNISAAKNNTYLDFVFLFFYSLFLFFTCKKIAVINNNKMGVLIAKGALAAGLLDILENTGMLITLSGRTSDNIALFTSVCSVTKWALATIALIYFIGGLIQLMGNKKLQMLLA